jgi:hypothetical protein
MKLVNERHQFINNHSDLYPFLKENFAEKITTGSIITLSIKHVDGSEKSIDIEVQESEKPMFDSLKEFINQID